MADRQRLTPGVAPAFLHLGILMQVEDFCYPSEPIITVSKRLLLQHRCPWNCGPMCSGMIPATSPCWCPGETGHAGGLKNLNPSLDLDLNSHRRTDGQGVPGADGVCPSTAHLKGWSINPRRHLAPTEGILSIALSPQYYDSNLIW